MLEDRDYMRQPEYGPRVSFTVALLIVNAIVFVGEWVAVRTPHAADFIGTYLSLSLPGLKSGYVWQLLSFQFLHANIWHLLFNSLAIFFFGRPVETAIGARRFLTLYFLSGIAGGIVQMLFALIFQQNGPVVGASAGAAGLIAAFSLMNWNEQITLIVYFIPVTMRGKTLLWVSIALAIAGMMMPSSTVANAAHLGGILFGFFYVYLIVQGRWHLPQFHLPARQAPPREFATRRAGKKSAWGSGSIPPDEDLTADEYLQKEVDPILDKISARGIQSLTQREREILEKARSRMNKR
jgi:membrane associated rhomboid family serine protease